MRPELQVIERLISIDTTFTFHPYDVQRILSVFGEIIERFPDFTGGELMSFLKAKYEDKLDNETIKDATYRDISYFVSMFETIKGYKKLSVSDKSWAKEIVSEVSDGALV